MNREMLKKNICLIMVACMMLSVVGCSSGSEASADANEVDPGETYVLKFAHDHMVSSPFHQSALTFKQVVEERSDGRISVEVYPAQQLGSSREMIEGMQMGTVEMTLLPAAKFGGFDPKLTLVDLPFLFPNDEVLWKVLEGDIGQEIMSGLDDIGISGVAFFAEGFKAFTANKEIHMPADFEGMKIRTMEAPVIMAQYSAWGANPVPVDFAEVYNSLQQGVVDGQENPLLSIHDMKFYEVQDNMIIGDHAYLSYFLSMSKSWFESLPKDLQDIVMETSLEVQQSHKQLMADANGGYLANIEASGTKVTYLTDEEKAAFKAASTPVYDEFKDIIGADILDRTQAFIEDNK
jgi:C4-dicarboxylate-binding protein DctP